MPSDTPSRRLAPLFLLTVAVLALSAGACTHREMREPAGTPPGGDAPPVCTSDQDCPAETWCRAREGGGSECVPFAAEGDRCGGFTLPSHQERCAPGLECTDFPEPTGDVPGYCRPTG